MRVDPVTPTPTPAAPRKAAAAPGFAALLDTPGGAADVARAGVASLPAEACAVAALTDAADQQARRHGRAMLKALGAVQLAILGGGEAEARAELAALTARLPQAEDPVLRLILREIGARAAVEMARGST